MNDEQFSTIVLNITYFALVQTLLESEQVMDIPVAQRMERQASLAKEHKEEYQAAIERAIALDVPLACSPSYGTFQEMDKGENSTRTQDCSLTSPERQESRDNLARVISDTDELRKSRLEK